MKAAKKRDTKPELQIRSILHRQGLRFRVDYRPLPELRTRADIVFTRRQVAVFIDGCYWHRCPTHGSWPKENAEWWRRKLETNVERDRRTTATLTSAGWTVLRIWEHEDPTEAATRVIDALKESSLRMARS